MNPRNTMVVIGPKKRKKQRQGVQFDQRWPKPTWLELEPGEEYLGSYPRWKRRATVLSIILGPSLAGPAAALSANDHAWVSIAMVIGGAIAALAPLISIRAVRVHVTSLAFVVQENKQYVVQPFSEITSISYGGSRESNRIYLHTSPKAGPLALMDSTNPQQTAEELSEMINRFSNAALQPIAGGK